MSSSLESYRGSIWWHDSLEPPCDLAAIDAGFDTEVAIVGGGFTGMSTALHLAEAGVRVALFEAKHIGFGASGRNGGQIIPGLKYDPEDLVAKYGPERGKALTRMVGGAADFAFDLIARHKINCRPLRGGWIQAAHSPLALEAVMKRAAQWRAEGVEVETFDRESLVEATGTTAHFGGWKDPRAGAVQPLDLLRGLTRAAQAAGAQVFENSAVTALTALPKGGWLLKVGLHEIRAAKVLVANNAYANRLVPGLARSILPVQSMQLATAPLPEDLRRKILPNGVMLSQTRKLAFYMRTSPSGGFMIGGRGAVGASEDPQLTKALERGMLKLFPDLAEVPILWRWSGHVGLSMDGLPHFHESQPGLYSLQAYNGRGVALSLRFGKMIADEITLRQAALYPKTAIKPILWHRFHRPVMGLGVRWYWMKDRLGLASK